MEIKEAKFLKSAAEVGGFLRPERPMIAVCGRSNAGKSSLINLLANRKNLAKTSSAPGRTRLVNYFDFGAFWLADLPGYGYAAVSRDEKARWGKTLDAFFAKKEDIRHVFLLIDIRRDPSGDDLQLVDFLNYHIIPFSVIATKSDKLSRMKTKERKRAIANAFGLGEANVSVVSSVTGDGKEEILSSQPDYEIGSFVNRRMTDISESIGYGDRKPHSNYDLESAILFYISHGMVERLKNFSFGDLHDRIGRTAHDDMRHFKNMVLILNSLSSRAAIKGGLDSETAYTLAEVYAQKIEVSRTLQDLQRLSQHLRLDYAQRVKDLKFANISDLTVTRAMKYASDHITEKISTAQIAKALNVTTPYLSGKFKTVTGLCLMDYIYSEKVKEAQYLLTYTDDPLSRIASYLAFSSQSYFQNIFKKYAGVTPNEYRTKNKNATY